MRAAGWVNVCVYIHDEWVAAKDTRVTKGAGLVNDHHALIAPKLGYGIGYSGKNEFYLHLESSMLFIGFLYYNIDI